MASNLLSPENATRARSCLDRSVPVPAATSYRRTCQKFFAASMPSGGIVKPNPHTTRCLPSGEKSSDIVDRAKNESGKVFSTPLSASHNVMRYSVKRGLTGAAIAAHRPSRVHAHSEPSLMTWRDFLVATSQIVKVCPSHGSLRRGIDELVASKLPV